MDYRWPASRLWLPKAIEELGIERLQDYRLPVVIIENPTEADEANQFRIVNENMKKFVLIWHATFLRCKFQERDRVPERLSENKAECGKPNLWKFAGY